MASIHLRRLATISSPKYSKSSAYYLPQFSYSSKKISFIYQNPLLRQFSTEPPSKADKTLSIAIVGTGPSGFYTAKYLQSAIHSYNKEYLSEHDNHVSLKMDMLDLLPTTYGLVRSGVAPDHPEVKNVQNDFQSLFEDSENYNMEFFGNVNLGSKDLSLSELRNLYDAVILAYGCQSDKKLGIVGEDLRGVLSAREFVNWYNGHPHFTHLGSKIVESISPNPITKKVAVIGQGNVALDCARILAKGGSGLFHTDLASHTLPILQDGVKETIVLGRRGHVQGAFTIKELRELTKLQKEGHNTDFVVRTEELDQGATESTLEELKSPTARPKVRIDKLLRDAAKNIAKGSEKQVSLRFLLNPIKFIPSDDDPSRLGSILCEKTKLEGEPGKQIAVGTGEFETINADMALISIGYKGVPLMDLEEKAFDSRLGIIKNVRGKVLSDDSTSNHDLYVSGWLKRGPSGIIGTNIADAKDTVATIMADLKHLLNNSKLDQNDNRTSSSDMQLGREGLVHMLTGRNVEFINWKEYDKIDQAEMDQNRLRSELQPREKFTCTKEMVSIAREAKK